MPAGFLKRTKGVTPERVDGAARPRQPALAAASRWSRAPAGGEWPARRGRSSVLCIARARCWPMCRWAGPHQMRWRCLCQRRQGSAPLAATPCAGIADTGPVAEPMLLKCLTLPSMLAALSCRLTGTLRITRGVSRGVDGTCLLGSPAFHAQSGLVAEHSYAQRYLCTQAFTLQALAGLKLPSRRSITQW